MKFNIAYGSNLSVEQMAFRCPDAIIAGKAVLHDWKLAFGRHATIEPCPGSEVPVLIWQISEEDESRSTGTRDVRSITTRSTWM